MGLRAPPNRISQRRLLALRARLAGPEPTTKAWSARRRSACPSPSPPRPVLLAALYIFLRVTPPRPRQGRCSRLCVCSAASIPKMVRRGRRWRCGSRSPRRSFWRWRDRSGISRPPPAWGPWGPSPPSIDDGWPAAPPGSGASRSRATLCAARRARDASRPRGRCLKEGSTSQRSTARPVHRGKNCARWRRFPMRRRARRRWPAIERFLAANPTAEIVWIATASNSATPTPSRAAWRRPPAATLFPSSATA